MNTIIKYLIFLSIFSITGIFSYAQNNESKKEKKKNEEKRKWSDINNALLKYESGNFNDAIKMLMLDTVKDNLLNNKQKVLKYRIMAKSFLEQNKEPSARAMCAKLLRVDRQWKPTDEQPDPRIFIDLLQIIKDSIEAAQTTSVSKKPETIKRVPATMTVLTAEDIKNRGYLDLEAVLHDLPGFDISRSNGNLYSNIYQRGYRSINTNHTLFLVDGIEENDLWSSNVYLSRQYPLSNIKNIDIVYGPASTLYGSNAFLGVINIITKEPWEMIKDDKSFGINARMAYGSYNTKFADISLAAQINKNISFSLTSRFFLSDEQDLSNNPSHSYQPRELTDTLSKIYHKNLDITDDAAVTSFLSKYPSSGTYYSLNGSNDIILTDAGINQALTYDNDVYNKASFSDYTQAFLVESKLKIYDFLFGYSYWNKAEGPGAQYNDSQFMGFDQGQSWRPVHTYIYAKYDKALTEKASFSNLISYKDHYFDKDNCSVRFQNKYSSGYYKLDSLIDGKIPKYDSTYLFQESDQIREEMKLVYQVCDRMDVLTGMELRFGNIQGDYTTSVKNNAEQSGSTLNPMPGGNHFFSRDIGIYAQTGIKIFKENLKLTLGLRWDNNRIREDEGYGSVFNPRIAAVYTPKSDSGLLKDLIIKVIYATAFKDATNRDKYSTVKGKRELSNPLIKPERVKNYEFSIGKTFPKQNFSVEAAAYYSQYKNIIQEIQTPKPDGKLTNQNQSIGKAEVFGINAMAGYKWENLTCYFNYTHTRPYAIDPTDNQGKPLLDADSVAYKRLRISDISNNQFNLGVNYLFKEDFNINLRGNFIGERITGINTTVPANLDKFKTCFILNGAFSYSPKKTGITAQFTIFNILNTEYFSPGLEQAKSPLSSSLKQNGRNFYLSIIYEF